MTSVASLSVHVRVRDFAGDLARLVDLVRAGDIPLARVDVREVTAQLVEQLEVLDVDGAGEAAALGAWLVELRAGVFYEEASRLLASLLPSEVLELPGKNGIIYIYAAGKDETEDPRAILRDIRIARERALVKALVASLEAQEVPRSFDHPDAGVDDVAGEDAGGANPERESDAAGESLGDIAKMLRAAANVLPDVEWSTVESLRQEIVAAVRGRVIRLSEVARGDVRRRVTAFLALLELVREPVLELGGGGGVLYVGVKAVQLEDDVAIGNPWDELPAPPPAPPRPRPRQERPAAAATRPVRRDPLGVLVEEAHGKLDAMDRSAGIVLTRAQTRAEILDALASP